MRVIKRGRMDRDALRRVLETRRRHLAEDLHLRVSRIRDQGASATEARQPDDDDDSDLDLKLIELVAQTLQRIDSAIERLEHGQYGRCVRCHRRIAAARLRAMPFAVRCRECETVREREAALSRNTVRGRLWERDLDQRLGPSA